MKFAAILMGLVFSVASFATEFSAKIENVNCTIANGEVVRTQTLGKKAEGSFTEKKNVTIKGIESFIQKSVETSSQVPASTEYSEFYEYKMIHEGKTYYLDTKDSDESMILVRMITKLCR